MNRYKCPDCKGYQYTANPHAAGSSCIYCKDGRVILDSEGVPNDKEKPEEKTDEQGMARTTISPNGEHL